MRARATCPQFRVLALGINAARGGVFSFPKNAKWEARARYWAKQGLIELLDEVPGAAEQPATAPAAEAGELSEEEKRDAKNARRREAARVRRETQSEEPDA